MSGLRVLVLESGGWGGIHHYAHALCNALATVGSDSMHVALLTTERYELEDRPCHFELMRVLRRENYLRTLWRVGRILKQWRPDILHVQTFIAPRKDLLLLAMCKLLGIRIVLTVHNVLPHEVRPLERQIYAQYYRLAAALILHSQRNGEQLQAMMGGFSEEHLHVVRHGNYEQFRYLETSRQEARARLGLPADARIALFFGMVRPYKGLDLLLAAAPVVCAACPQALFVVAGQVYEGRAGYEEQIARSGLPVDKLRVHFDYLSMVDLIAHVRAADLIVLPYREIYQSGVLFFAYSFGRPVVATRVGSFPESIEEGRSGWLVDPEDVEGLERALCVALADPERLQRAGARARELADSCYGWQGIAEDTLRIYQEVVGS